MHLAGENVKRRVDALSAQLATVKAVSVAHRTLYMASKTKYEVATETIKRSRQVQADLAETERLVAKRRAILEGLAAELENYDDDFDDDLARREDHRGHVPCLMTIVLKHCMAMPADTDVIFDSFVIANSIIKGIDSMKTIEALTSPLGLRVILSVCGTPVIPANLFAHLSLSLCCAAAPQSLTLHKSNPRIAASVCTVLRKLMDMSDSCASLLVENGTMTEVVFAIAANIFDVAVLRNCARTMRHCDSPGGALSHCRCCSRPNIGRRDSKAIQSASSGWLC